jgi:hypothetical protein
MAFQYDDCRKIKIVIQYVHPEISSTNINEKVYSAKKKSIPSLKSKIPGGVPFLEYQG